MPIYHVDPWGRTEEEEERILERESKEKERDKKHERERDYKYKGDRMKGGTDFATLIVYGGAIYLAYLVFKSWGVISSANIVDKPSFNWTPLSEYELNKMKVDEINPYYEDIFERRTGRGQRGYGFAGIK